MSQNAFSRLRVIGLLGNVLISASLSQHQTDLMYLLFPLLQTTHVYGSQIVDRYINRCVIVCRFPRSVLRVDQVRHHRARPQLGTVPLLRQIHLCPGVQGLSTTPGAGRRLRPSSQAQPQGKTQPVLLLQPRTPCLGEGIVSICWAVKDPEVANNKQSTLKTNFMHKQRMFCHKSTI